MLQCLNPRAIVGRRATWRSTSGSVFGSGPTCRILFAWWAPFVAGRRAGCDCCWALRSVSPTSTALAPMAPRADPLRHNAYRPLARPIQEATASQIRQDQSWIKPHVQCPVNQTETAQCANLCRLVDRSHAGVKPLPRGPWRSASYVSAQRHLDVQTFDRYRTSALLPQTPIIQHTRIIARSCMTDASP